MKATTLFVYGIAVAAGATSMLHDEVAVGLDSFNEAVPEIHVEVPTRDARPSHSQSVARWPRSDTPRPKRSEWKNADEVALTRNTDRTCKAKRIREWLQIRCTGWDHSGDSPMIAGNKANVDMWIARREWPAVPATVVVMPVRVGDRRVFQLNLQHRWGTSPSAMVSELWLDDASEPVITITDV